MTVFVQECGWIFTLAEQKKTALDPCGQHVDHCEPAVKPSRGVAVRMKFGGAAPAIPVTEHRLPGVHNYFFGRDPKRWQSGIPLHGAIRMVGLYPGIDVCLRTKEGRFEYDLLLEPGADLASVVLEVEGASGLALDTLGALVIDTALGQVKQTVPKTWQVTGDGLRQEVACHFVLKGEGVFGFAVPEWDHEFPLSSIQFSSSRHTSGVRESTRAMTSPLGQPER